MQYEGNMRGKLILRAIFWSDLRFAMRQMETGRTVTSEISTVIKNKKNRRETQETK